MSFGRKDSSAAKPKAPLAFMWPTLPDEATAPLADPAASVPIITAPPADAQEQLESTAAEALPAPEPASPVDLHPSGSREARTAARLADMRDTMLRLLGTAIGIADAVRNNEDIALPGLDIEIHANTTPFDIKGFHEHFTYKDDDGNTLHTVYGYMVPGNTADINQMAQSQIYSLVARMMEMNLHCQRAYKEGALLVALQSPRFPPLVDRILAGCAFFAGYFENLALTQPLVEPGSNETAQPQFDMAALAVNMERRRLMAFDRMLFPETLETLLPFQSWPFFGVETPTRPHSGQKFVNGVYFPRGLTPPEVPPVIRSRPAAA